jgi:hypothetical protein
MNYKKVYDKIIENRLNNPLSKDEYGERHHIVPLSLGGNDDEGNLVRLSAREHFICHALLSEMYEEGTNEWYKMNHAFMMMKSESTFHSGNRYFNSRLYELKRKDFSKVMSRAQNGKNNSQYGKVWIYNTKLEKSVKVDKSKLDEYIIEGWAKGRIVDFNKMKKSSHKTEEKFYNEKVLSNYLMGIIENKFKIKSNDRIGSINSLKDLLYEKYVIQDKSTTDLAKEYDVTDPTIRRYLLWLGIGTKGKNGKWV